TCASIERGGGEDPTKGGHMLERNLRRKSKGELNNIFATLGIEKDNDSDEDFVLERSDDEDEEGNLDDPDPVNISYEILPAVLY
ncbi:hypothetical protein GN958_ATG20763, partial [Phytophthora infestans]